MEEEFRALLRGDAAVTAICGQRVNFGTHPQGKPRPAIVMHVIDNGQGHTLKGRDGLQVGRVQVNCQAATYTKAKELSRAVIDRLSGHRGGNFSGIFLAHNRDNQAGGSNEAERPFEIQLDFTTHWRA